MNKNRLLIVLAGLLLLSLCALVACTDQASGNEQNTDPFALPSDFTTAEPEDVSIGDPFQATTAPETLPSFWTGGPIELPDDVFTH